MHTISDRKLLMLKPDEIKPSENQPRKSFDEYELNRLADSIRTSGIIQPLSVRKTADGKYELIAGERRLKAALIAGLRRIPCILHKTSESDAAIYSIIENLQRSNLTPFEEAEGIRRIVSLYGMSQTEIAARLGIAQSTLSNKLRLLQLGEELRKQIVGASLTERHARALLRLPESERAEALNRIIAEGMTLKQSEDYISGLLIPKEEIKTDAQEETIEKPFRKSAIGDMRLFGNSLSKLINTLKSAGIDAHSHKHETNKYIEYKVRIKKEPSCSGAAVQLKIC